MRRVGGRSAIGWLQNGHRRLFKPFLEADFVPTCQTSESRAAFARRGIARILSRVGSRTRARQPCQGLAGLLGIAPVRRRKSIAAARSRRLHPARPIHRFAAPINRMVRSPPARSHSSAHAWGVAPARSSPSRRRNSCAGCCGGSTSRPARNCSVNAARSEALAAAPGIRGAGKCLGTANSRAPHRELRSENARSALPDGQPLDGAAFRRIPPRSKDLSTATAASFPPASRHIAFFIREDADWMIRALSTAADGQCRL